MKVTETKTRRTEAGLSCCDKRAPYFMTVIVILNRVKAELRNSFNTEQILVQLLTGGLKIIASFCMGGLFGQIRNLSFYFQKIDLEAQDGTKLDIIPSGRKITEAEASRFTIRLIIYIFPKGTAQVIETHMVFSNFETCPGLEEELA